MNIENNGGKEGRWVTCGGVEDRYIQMCSDFTGFSKDEVIEKIKMGEVLQWAEKRNNYIPQIRSREIYNAKMIEITEKVEMEIRKEIEAQAKMEIYKTSNENPEWKKYNDVFNEGEEGYNPYIRNNNK